MKYQIYLNKETTIILNYMANKLNVKPVTLIKQLLEETIVSAKNVVDAKKEEEKHGITRN